VNRWERIYDWQMVFVGFVGAVLTVLFAGPGEHTVDIVSLGVDPFYVLFPIFVAVSL